MFRTSPKIGDRWEVPKDEINESEFDESRRCLLNTYNSYIQTHAGYMIALIIGLLALISAFSAFVKNLGSWAAFIFLIIVIVGAMFYVALRISYWTYFASAAIGIPLEDIIALFNKNNRESTNPFTKKPPSLVILQDAIWQHLIDEFNDGRLSWILKLIMIFLKRKKKEK